MTIIVASIIDCALNAHALIDVSTILAPFCPSMAFLSSTHPALPWLLPASLRRTRLPAYALASARHQPPFTQHDAPKSGRRT